MGLKPRSPSAANQFMFLTVGFERPTPEDMAKWGTWFKSIANRMVDQGGFWSGGREFTKDGMADLPFGPDAITGFVVFTAKDLGEAEALAKTCPIVASNRLYEIMRK